VIYTETSTMQMASYSAFFLHTTSNLSYSTYSHRHLF